MATKIARGQTKQADLISTENYGAVQPTDYWAISGGMQSGQNTGWNLTPDGKVTIPASGGPNTPFGLKTATFIFASVNGANSARRIYQFEYVAASDLCANNVNSISLSEPTNNSTITYNIQSSVENAEAGVSYSLTVVVDWKDGTIDTYHGTATSQTPFLVAASHTYSAAGDYVPSWTADIDGCEGTAPHTRTTVYVRYLCDGSSCLLKVVSVGQGYMTCAEANCGAPPDQGPFACLPDPYGVNRCTNQIPQGYTGPMFIDKADCLEGGCEDTMEERWFCENNTCVPHMVSDGSGHDSPGACALAGCGPTDPAMEERYFCENNNCEPRMVSDGSGYDSWGQCYEAGCHGGVDCNLSLVVTDEGDFWRVTLEGFDGMPSITGYSGNNVVDPINCLNSVTGARYCDFDKSTNATLFKGVNIPFGSTVPNCEITEVPPPAIDCSFGTPVVKRFRVERGTFPGDQPRLLVSATVIENWFVTLHYTLDGATRTVPNPEFNFAHTEAVWYLEVEVGTYELVLEYTKSGCAPHIVESDYTIYPTGVPYWCVNGACVHVAAKPAGTGVKGPFQTADACTANCGGTDPGNPDGCYGGDGWYCVSSVPTRLTTYEAWVSANKPSPRYATKTAAACYVAPPPCSNTVVFDAPAADATVTSLETIVVHYVGNSILADADPVTIRFNGTALAVEQSPGDERQFFARVPEELGEWQGVIRLSAQLKHADGCLSPTVTCDVNVNGTILDDTRWGDVLLEEATPHDCVQVDALLDPPTLENAWYYEFAVSSPVPDDSPPPDAPTHEDQLDLEQTWVRLQKCALSADTPLLGLRDENGEYAAPTTDALCRIKAYRQWKRIKYRMEAPLTKIRWSKDTDGTDALLFYALPYIYKLDASGFKLFQDLRFVPIALGVPLRDASVRRGKTFVVAGYDETHTTFAEVDTDAPDSDGAQISQTSAPFGAPANAAWVETMKATGEGVVSIVRVFCDASKSMLYESWPGVDGMETRKRFEVPGAISYFTILGATVAFVVRGVGADAGTNGSKIYVWKRGDSAPTLRLTSPSPVTFIHLESEAGALCFGNEGDDLIVLPASGTAQTFLVDAGFAPRATTLYNPGSGNGDVRAYGGDDERVWWKPKSAFIPLLPLADNESVVGMERWNDVVVKGDGDPLNGGTPAVSLDSLLVAVHSDGLDYVLRYQRLEKGSLAYEGSGIADLEFSSTLPGVGAVAGI